MSEIDEYDRETINALMIGYQERWRESTYRAVCIEEEFLLPILNPHSDRLSMSRTFDYAGKVDLIVDDPTQPGKRWLMDHKSSSEDISNPASDFWLRLRNATQPSHYQLALKQLGIEIDGCIWDVIRKPTIRPRKLTKAERQEISDHRTYFGISVNLVQAPENETPILYGARVLADIREQPGKYYQRQIVPRTSEDLYEYASELFGLSTRIRDAARTNQFFKTGEPHSCTLYNRSCEYLPLCAREGSELDYLRQDPHEELEGVNGSLKILTNSSISMFRQCERKYRYRYVDGLKSPTKSEALTFGSALHVALNNYWSYRIAPEGERVHLGGCVHHES